MTGDSEKPPQSHPHILSTQAPRPAPPAEVPGTLAGIALLRRLPHERIQKLDQMCAWRVVSEGDEIMTRDQQTSDVHFIVKGKVRIVNYSASGREVAYATADSGDYFGELSALDHHPRSASVIALDECKLAIMSASLFCETIKSDPEIGFCVLQKLAAIIRANDDRIMDLATLSAYQRVYLELLKLKRVDPVRPNSWLIYPLPTQASIAALASTTRETVARVLGQLQSDGITDRKGKTLYIRQLEKLQRLAERSATQPDGDAR